jgi:3-phenylpropionate/cinnamic acid dioxygenase small subunit
MGGNDGSANCRGGGMSALEIPAALEAVDRLAVARDIIEREAILLDEQRWDEWLELFTADCIYWLPAWGRDGKLGSDPARTLSLIYYDSRAGLEDRVVRIRSGQSPAGRPPLRTTHMLSSIRLENEGDGGSERIHARASFTNHAFFPRQEQSEVYFGHSRFVLQPSSGTWKIAAKTIVLQNDYIATYLEVCCL